MNRVVMSNQNLANALLNYKTGNLSEKRLTSRFFSHSYFLLYEFSKIFTKCISTTMMAKVHHSLSFSGLLQLKVGILGLAAVPGKMSFKYLSHHLRFQLGQLLFCWKMLKISQMTTLKEQPKCKQDGWMATLYSSERVRSKNL